MFAFFNYLHAVALLETFVFLYFVEQRPGVAPTATNVGHFCVASALIALAAYIPMSEVSPSDAEPVSVLLATAVTAAVAFVALVVAPLIAATYLRRRAKDR